MKDEFFDGKNLTPLAIECLGYFFEDCIPEDENSMSHKIRMLIKEEYGIADEVEKATIDMKKYIEVSIADIRGDFPVYSGNFTRNYFGTDIDVVCTIKNFNNIEEANKTLSKCFFNHKKRIQMRI